MKKLWRDEEYLSDNTDLRVINLPLYQTSKLSFDEYKRVIFDFQLRWLLYEHYDFCKKRNKEELLSYIQPIIKCFFNYSEDYYKNKYKQNVFGIKINMKPNEIRYFVMLDVMKSQRLITQELINKFNNKNDLANFCVKSILEERFDNNKNVEKMLNPTVCRKDTDIDYSNIVLASIYNDYIEYVDKIKRDKDIHLFDKKKIVKFFEDMGVEDTVFINYINNAEDDHFMRRSKTIALDILQRYCQRKNFNRVNIRKKIEKGFKEIKAKKTYSSNKLAKFDNKMLDIIDLKSYSEEKHPQVFDNLEALSKSLSTFF
jgi:hypothetical protein